jgi:YggT family protein
MWATARNVKRAGEPRRRGLPALRTAPSKARLPLGYTIADQPAFREYTAKMNVILGPLLQVILIIIELYMWAVIIGVVLSWLVAFNVVNTSNRFVYMVGDFIYRITEPLQGPLRRMLPNLGGLDLSPMVLILGLIFLRGVISNLLYRVG